jgi:glycosyltransferase involved in cell wall biosynthesis
MYERTNLEMSLSIVVPIKELQPQFYTRMNFLFELMHMNDEIIIIAESRAYEVLKNSLKLFQKDENSYKLIRNIKPGLANSLNLGVSQSKNEWILRIDIDDEILPEILDLQRSQIKTTTAVIFCDYTFSSTNNKYLGYMPSGVNDNAIRLSLISGRRTPHPGALFSKSIFDKVGGYDSAFTECEDLDLWLRMSTLGTFSSSPYPLIKYRLSSNSKTILHRQKVKRIKKQIPFKTFLPETFMLKIVDELETIKLEYTKYPYCSERIQFLLIDLIKLSWMHRNFSVIKLALITLIKNLIAHLGPTIGILKFFFMRSLYRKLLRFPSLRNS